MKQELEVNSSLYYVKRPEKLSIESFIVFKNELQAISFSIFNPFIMKDAYLIY